jgi:mono/diheme cytochrome c family protein
MTKGAVASIGVVTVALVSTLISGATALQPATTSTDRALLNQYCVSCHNQRLKTAGLMLDTADVNDVPAGAEIWEKVIEKVRSNAMPPPGRPRPDAPAAQAFVKRLESALDQAALAHPNPGRLALHRLNRSEYANAIQDLFALNIDARSMLFADDADQHGFDNNADVLSVSPALMERYMSAARKVARQALGRTGSNPVSDTYSVPRMLVQDTRTDDDLPFGARGGVAVRHRFPVDGEYRLKVKLQTNLYDYIRGLGQPHQLDVWLDSARIKRFTIGGDNPDKPAPAGFAGAIFGDTTWEDYSHNADKSLEFPFTARAGERVVAVSFVGRAPTAAEGVLLPRQVGYPLSVNEAPDGDPAVDFVQITGPLTVAGPGDTPSRRRVLLCQPSKGSGEACATKIFGALARRAYRRAVTPQDVRALMVFYEQASSEGGFEAGIEAGLERMLVDPEFLFRVEGDRHDTSGQPFQISDVELASRLSFFLWSSIPDDTLLDLAEHGKLRAPGVLDAQVRRMLADPRARRSLVDNFAGQWLVLRNVDSISPNTDLFHEFDENLRSAMKKETELFIEDQLRADKAIPELLSAKYTFLNERLARHYGIRNVYGDGFRRVDLEGTPRGGLLGQASLLTVTSYPDRTSPVLRGKWVLENMLGAPPPPPPPVVPALKDKGPDGRPAAVRDRLEEHRKNPACTSCHLQMDPLGFALENFDAIGTWRSHAEGGAPVDASAALVDGTKFTGMPGLRELLLSRQDQFAATVTEKLLSYALGRTVEYYDKPSVRQIVRHSAADNYRWSAVILEIVKSQPFQMRRSEQ